MNKIVALTLVVTLLIVGTFFYFSSLPSVEERLSKNFIETESEHVKQPNQSEDYTKTPIESLKNSKIDTTNISTIDHQAHYFSKDDGVNYTAFGNVNDYSAKPLSSAIAEANVGKPKSTDYNLNNYRGTVVNNDSPIIQSPLYERDALYDDPFEMEYDYPSYSYCDCTRWGNGSWIYVDHVEGHWRDNKEGYTSLGVFMTSPYFSYHFVPFVDMRAHVLNNGRFAANLGGGLRYQPFNSQTIYGINAYYDSRIAAFRNKYEQLGVGLEVLNPCGDLRINGYIPIGNRIGHSKLCVFDNIGDGFEATSQEKKRSMGGFDVEVGRWFNSCKFFSLYGAVGAYAYFPKVERHNAYGCEARVESALYRNLFLEVRGSYDRIFHGNVQARLTYVVPFTYLFDGICNDCDSGCSCLIYQPVHREEMIVLDKKQCCWTWNWDDSGSSCSHCK